jgi:uncharacterized membrane protein
LSASCSAKWTIPCLYSGAAILLGFILPRIENRCLHWSSGLNTASAIAIYSSVATGMITLTGMVFSLAFVMVQFGATAYSPRLVLWMSRDPLVSHAIGIFAATFLYALAALAWVDRGTPGHVPFLSAWVVVFLLIGSMGAFIGLVQRLSRLQISNVLAFTGDFARQTIDSMYPPLGQFRGETEEGGGISSPLIQSIAYHGPPRALQSLSLARLVKLAEGADATIELTSAVGDTLVESRPLFRVYGRSARIAEHELMTAIRTGTERTFEQDPKYSIQLLRDIAIRALSPAVNDPTTAVQALDQIEDVVLRLGRRRIEINNVVDSGGRLRVVILTPAWTDFLDVAFSEIRYYGAQSIQVMRRMTALLRDLRDALPEERRPAVREQQKRLEKTIVQSFPNFEDQVMASVEDREGLGSQKKPSTSLVAG